MLAQVVLHVRQGIEREQCLLLGQRRHGPVVAGLAQALLAAEVVGDEGGGHPCASSDASHRRSGEAVLGELHEGGVADASTGGEVSRS